MAAAETRRPSAFSGGPLSGSLRCSAPTRADAWPWCGASTSSTCCRSTGPSRMSEPRSTCRRARGAPPVCSRVAPRTARCCCSTGSSSSFPARIPRLRMIRRAKVTSAGATRRSRVANLADDSRVSRPSVHEAVPSRTVTGFPHASLERRGNARRRLADPHTFASFVPVRLRRLSSRRGPTTQEVEVVMHQHPSQGGPVLPTNPRTFAELGVSARTEGALRMRGIDGPFEIQGLVIPDAIAGRDVLARSRTGSGKTLAFAVPIVERLTPSGRSPSALILAPTRELASQVTEDFRAIADVAQLQVAAVYGGVGIGPQAKRARHADILVATPRPPARPRERAAAPAGPRAHLRARRGRPHARHGVPPDVKRILEMLRPDRQTMLFSATLDGEVGRLADRFTRDAVRHEVGRRRRARSPTPTTGSSRWSSAARRRRSSASSPPIAGSTLVFVRTQARRGPAGAQPPQARLPGRRAARRDVPAAARARARAVRLRRERCVGRDRRRRARSRPRGHHARDQLRCARPTRRPTSTASAARRARAAAARASRSSRRSSASRSAGSPRCSISTRSSCRPASPRIASPSGRTVVASNAGPVVAGRRHARAPRRSSPGSRRLAPPMHASASIDRGCTLSHQGRRGATTGDAVRQER